MSDSDRERIAGHHTSATPNGRVRYWGRIMIDWLGNAPE